MYPALNLPPASIPFKDGKIRDILRNKYLKATPEEWVRQHFIHYLINHLHFPRGRMVSEYKVNYNGMNKRCDIAVFDRNNNAQVIVECKAPKIALTEDTFYQIAKYTHVLNAPVLVLTNGMTHYCTIIDRKNNRLNFLEAIPDYRNIETVID